MWKTNQKDEPLEILLSIDSPSLQFSSSFLDYILRHYPYMCGTMIDDPEQLRTNNDVIELAFDWGMENVSMNGKVCIELVPPEREYRIVRDSSREYLEINGLNGEDVALQRAQQAGECPCGRIVDRDYSNESDCSFESRKSVP